MPRPSKQALERAKKADAKSRKQAPATPYSLTTVAKICDLLANGASLAEACRMPGMPAVRTFQQWRREHPDVEQRYTHACWDRADGLAAQIYALQEGVTNENYNAQRVRIDTLKWLAGKMHARAWGERKPMTVELDDSTAELPSRIEITIVRYGDDAADPTPDGRTIDHQPLPLRQIAAANGKRH